MSGIGIKIRKIRELKDYTQEYMAVRLGISQSSYAKIEKNETPLTLTRLEEIATILQIDPISIMTFDKDHVVNNTYYAKVKYGPYIDQRTSSAEQLDVYKKQLESLEKQVQALQEIIKAMTNNNSKIE